jgi:hypothetical protein
MNRFLKTEKVFSRKFSAAGFYSFNRLILKPLSGSAKVYG